MILTLMPVLPIRVKLNQLDLPQLGLLERNQRKLLASDLLLPLPLLLLLLLALPLLARMLPLIL
jgi:hypothetical protein|uniref:Uncharacterized protein n=1 Tax=Picea glauca TaxID=3330 RepID=A0A124GMI1_PICGL|nr:hypothetical protein ABT39_MTgene2304 [Picea glauca]QHR89279.1 hypothetical protein Q903MT_gene3300 [Picea sitchensis]